MADHNRIPVTLTMQEAGRLVVYHQGLRGSGDPDRIIQAFTPDAVVHFADFPETRGQAALRQFLVSRFAPQKNYRLKKQLRAVSGNMIVCSWDGA
jgi:nuclear transport factor 2 (NTF2) superfamily protein